MTRLALLGVRMLRYRVATMIWLFMLLGAGGPDGLAGLSLPLLLAAVALGLTYVAATTENDVADREIDRVNHPHDRGRPLVTGEASVGDLLRLHRLAAVGALAAVVLVSPWAVALVAVSLLVSRAYSRPPALVSHRTWLAHPLLGVAYVAIPYALGAEAADRGLGRADAPLAAGLFCLFLARIVLKDFRDREGDARFGKPTLLLRFGKPVTCAVSLGALVAGTALLLAALRPPPPDAALLLLFAAGAAAMLGSLVRAAAPRAEQVAIGIGAKAGNGLLLATLAWLALGAAAAPAGHRTALVAALAAAVGAGYAVLVAQPERAVVGYKG